MSEAIVADIRRIAQEEGVDPDLAVRVAKQESGFRQDATSRAGARGIMQLMPDTAKELGVDLNDPMQNIRGGVRYLGQQQRAFGSPDSALAAYNAGPGRVRDYLRTGRQLPQETKNYVSALSGAGISPDIMSAEYRTAAGDIIVPGGEGPRRTAPGEELLSADVTPTTGFTQAELASFSPETRAIIQRGETLRGDLAKATEEIARLAGQKEETLTAGAARAARQSAETQRRAVEEYEANRKIAPEFVPTQETAGDIASLFGLIGVFGTLVGGGGKQNAVAAMNAMTGMMSGWRQGRQDLYNRERQIFDTNVRQLEARNAELRRSLESNLKLAQTNLDAALANIRSDAARLGSSILLEQARAGNLQGLVQSNQELQKMQFEVEKYRRQQTELVARQEEAERRRRLASAGPMADQIMERQSPEAAQRTRELLSRTDLGARGRQNLEASYAALEGSERVARSVSQNRDAVDALASAINRARADQVAGLLQRFFNGQSSQQELFNGLDRVIDQAGLSGDVASRAKVIQKELFSLALSDAQATGRPTVFLERALSGFYAQNLRPETLIELIKDRAKEAVTRIPNATLRPDTLTNYRQDFSLLATPNANEFMRLHPEPESRRRSRTTQPAAPPADQRSRGLQAIERARQELGPNASDDDVVARARELLR